MSDKTIISVTRVNSDISGISWYAEVDSGHGEGATASGYSLADVLEDIGAIIRFVANEEME